MYEEEEGSGRDLEYQTRKYLRGYVTLQPVAIAVPGDLNSGYVSQAN